MARAQRQPRARSEILSDPRMDATAGGDALRRAHALHEIAARRGLVVQSSSGIQRRSWLQSSPALVAQLDRAPDFESGGRGFESLRARQHLDRFSTWRKSTRVTPGVTVDRILEPNRG